MAITNGYISLAALKTVLRDNTGTYDAIYEIAIESASRQIDRYCGTHFWKPASPTVRTFLPEHRYVIHTGDFANTTGLVIKTDDDDDGVFETPWDVADYQVEPLNPYDGRPYNRITAVGAREFPLPYWEHHRFLPTTYERDYRPSRRARVQVTANWGWDVVPRQVAMACQILAIDNFKSKDLTGTTTGIAELGQPGLGGFRFTGATIPKFNPIAEALLQGFRNPVIS